LSRCQRAGFDLIRVVLGLVFPFTVLASFALSVA